MNSAGNRALRGAALAASLLVLLLTLPVAAAEGDKLTAPTEAEQKAALALAKEVFAEQYRAARSADQKKALAELLHQRAAESLDDRPAQFVLFRLARDLAASAADLELAMRTIDQMSATFVIDPLPMKRDALARAVEVADGARQLDSLLGPAESALLEAAEADRFDLAAEMGKLALSAARRAKAPEALRRLSDRAKQVQEQAAEYEKTRAALAVLDAKPADPDANLAAGRYVAFVKGDWGKGVGMLALGNDPRLKAAAVKELEDPSDADDLVALADAWWDIAQEQEGTVKTQILSHAVSHYRRAAASLAGLARQRVEKRIAESAGTATATARPGGRAAELIVGDYAVSTLDRRVQRPVTVYWAFTPERVVVEKSRVIGQWRPTSDTQIRVILENEALGEINLKIQGRDAFSGTARTSTGDTRPLTLQRMIVVSRWRHQAQGGPEMELALWSNGRFGQPYAKHSWQLKANRLTLRWESGFVDQCVISSDGQTYEGRNQSGVVIRGQRLPNP